MSKTQLLDREKKDLETAVLNKDRQSFTETLWSRRDRRGKIGGTDRFRNRIQRNSEEESSKDDLFSGR